VEYLYNIKSSVLDFTSEIISHRGVSMVSCSKKELLHAIYQNCIDCSSGDSVKVKECDSKDSCALWRYRLMIFSKESSK
jgi:hypothetical protein